MEEGKKCHNGGIDQNEVGKWSDFGYSEIRAARIYWETGNWEL